MFAVELNKENFEYDVHALVTAFWPGEIVRVITPQMSGTKRDEAADNVKITILINTADAYIEINGHKYEYQSEGVNQDKEQFKKGFKSFLYRVLREETGKELPWGSLTGIRPTKIAYSLLEQGKTEEQIVEYFRSHYFVSEEKARLGTDIAVRERALLMEDGSEEGYSIYIGIPFCPTTCLYCSFTSFAIGAYKDTVERYIDCLIQEMEYTSHAMEGKKLKTVYIGGGTPTTLEAGQLDRLIGRLKELFELKDVREFTVEAGRADSITAEKLKVLRRHGVTRISINPQTMKQETLDLIGRRHTVEQVVQAFHLAREQGFDNINMDLILGLPGETCEDVEHTMEQIYSLAPDSLTVHSLAVKRASRLSRWIQENGARDFLNTEETMQIADCCARKLGMEPYYLYRQKNMAGNFENVGYALPGKFGLYNILIMEERQTIVAMGAGSITKAVFSEGRIERCENVKDVRLYLEKIDEMIERKSKLLQTGL